MLKRLIVFAGSTIAAYGLQLLLPWLLGCIDRIPYLPVILGMKPRYYLAVVLFMMLYEYYNRLRGKGYLVDSLNSNIEDMGIKAMSKCYIEFVTDDSTGIAEHFRPITATPIDLAWEPQLIGLISCHRDNCDRWKNDHMSKRLSTLRRKRMISISTALINWQTNMCYAMECHLDEIITNREKYQNDEEYRNIQIEKLKSGVNRFLKPDCRRIVVIHQQKWNKISDNHRYQRRLENYLRWHINNQWNIKLYIVKDDIQFRMSVLGNMPIGYDDLTDFVIIGNRYKKGVVFAQNNKEMAQIINANSTPSYENWYHAAWERLACEVIEGHTVNNDFLKRFE